MYGYSNDVGGLGTKKCWNTLETRDMKMKGFKSIEDSVTHKQLSKILKLDMGPGSSFSWEPYAHYMRHMEDSVFSQSFNYYKIAYDTVSVDLAGSGVDALNDYGKDMYVNAGNYDYFGVQCGDNYVTHYKDGAMLLYGINVEFESIQEKKLYQDLINTPENQDIS